MFCTNCGVKLELGNTFCTQCGTKVDDQISENEIITEDKTKEIVENIESIADEEPQAIINYEPDESYFNEDNLLEEENDFLPNIIRNQDEFANKLKDKFSYQKKDLIEALKERKKDAQVLFKKASKKTKESISKMLENEIDIMEVKLEKLESIFQKGLLPEDEYNQMRVKAIKESLESKTTASMILENQMDAIEAKLEKLKNMFERNLISKDEYNSIRKKIINI